MVKWPFIRYHCPKEKNAIRRPAGGEIAPIHRHRWSVRDGTLTVCRYLCSVWCLHRCEASAMLGEWGLQRAVLISRQTKANAPNPLPMKGRGGPGIFHYTSLSNLETPSSSHSVLILCVVTALGLRVAAASSKHDQCSEPSDLALQDYYRRLRDGDFRHSDVYQPHPTRNTTAHIIPINGKPSFKYPMRRCQCVSRDEINFDPQRIPKAIPQSPCDKTNSNTFHRYQTECRDVLEDIFVYRRTDKCVNSCGTLHETHFDTLHKTPYDTLHETPYDTLHETPYGTLHETPYDTLHETPHDTLHETPYDTLHETPYDVLHETPYDILHETPYDTLRETPYDILHEAPYDILHETPCDTLHET
ncbi:hypothetical protein Btru_043078 [Bulinus truncatus]|nr:hypothetical protein Btru_043078 [Bulinus truncatus]